MVNIIVVIISILFTIINLAQSKFVYHEFDVHYFPGAPNGVAKQILGVNNRFPGPTIHANLGDVLIIKVINNIQTKENTSIHWHGLEQYQTLFEDGPEYVTQCPIMYGTSQLYQFQLKQTGTYWWHSHHSWQYTDGYWGALVVKNQTEIYQEYYDNELIITLNDWHNIPADVITSWYLSPESQGNPPIPDSILINGRGFYSCPVAIARGFSCNPKLQRYSSFSVIKGTRYRLRVVNTAAAATIQFSIDGHKLQVIEVDGVDTVLTDPVDVATLAPAQRYSFIVTMNGSLNEYWIRAEAVGIPKLTPNINLDPDHFQSEVLAILKYVDTGLTTSSSSSLSPQIATDATQGRPALHGKYFTRSRLFATMEETKLIFANSSEIEELAEEFHHNNSIKNIESRAIVSTGQILPTTSPIYPPIELDEQNARPYDSGLLAPNYFSEEHVLSAVRMIQADKSVRWSFNNIPYTMSVNAQPALYSVLKSRRVSRGFNPIYTTFGNGKVIQVVINNQNVATHPFHLHGHTFWILGHGSGVYNSTIHESTLRYDVVRRDTLTVPGFSWVVMRYYADNPGTWLLHCHINWHLHAGLGLVFVEGSDAIRSFTRLPNEWLDVCHRSGYNVTGFTGH